MTRDEIADVIRKMEHPANPAQQFAAAWCIAYDPQARAAWRAHQQAKQPRCPHPRFTLGRCDECDLEERLAPRRPT